MQPALSLAFSLCGLLSSISCEWQELPGWGHAEVSSEALSLAACPYEDKEDESFGDKMLKALMEEHPQQNVVFSPFSIFMALAMVSESSRSMLITNLLHSLQFDIKIHSKKAVEERLQVLLHRVNQLKTKKLVKHKDLIFIDKHRQVEHKFLDIISKTRDVHTRNMSFLNSEIAKWEIQQLVGEKLHDSVGDLIPTLSPRTFMVLVDYMAFKGAWKETFELISSKETFFVNENKTVQVNMLRRRAPMEYGRWEEMSASMVQVPYPENLCLLLVLPDKGHFNAVLEKMDSNHRWDHFKGVRMVDLFIPKMKMSFKTNLKQVFRNQTIHGIISAAVNSSRIIGSTPLTVFEAVHKAKLKMGHTDMSVAEEENSQEEMENSEASDPSSGEAVVLKFIYPFLAFVIDLETHEEVMVAGVINPKEG